MLVLCNFLRKLMVSDKKIHRAFRTHTTLYTKPIREIFHFHHFPKLYIGFKGIQEYLQNEINFTEPG